MHQQPGETAQEAGRRIAVAIMHPKRFTHNPYNFQCSKEYPELRCLGVRPYSHTPLGHAAPPPPPAGAIAGTVVVGNTPYSMTTAQIRREVAAITGVVLLSVSTDFGCRRRALYRVKSDNADAVLACSRRALLCPEFVWMLPDEAAEMDVVTEALQYLRHCGFVRHGPITFELERARRPPVEVPRTETEAGTHADTHADSPERHAITDEDAIIAD
jgi:hypothetical protein